MYTRETEPSPDSFVRSKKPVFGTFEGHAERLDIRGVFKPYGTLPLPTFITNLRIKSRLVYIFSIGEYLGSIQFLDAKIFGMAEVCFWNTRTRQKYVYRSVMGPRKRFVPHSLNLAATTSYRKSRYIRISWDRKNNRLSMIFDLKGDSARPRANAALSSTFDSGQFSELTCVIPAPTLRRSSASYYAMFPLSGAVNLIFPNGEFQAMQKQDGVSFLDINRTYMKFRSHGEVITCLSNLDEKLLSLRLKSTSHDAVNPNAYNANVLFYDGKPTPLPPVVITHHYGLMNQWIIQDTENMVDLTFTPCSENINKLSVVILRAVTHTIYGTLEGVVCTSSGEKISIKSLPCLTENYLIRL